MKLSNETIAILKNFSSINTNILIREGNLLSTITAGKGLFARATVEEKFPLEFAIYDLNSLLSLLTLAEDQDIEFGEKSLIVSKDGGRFEYFYSSPSIIVAAPNKTIEFDSFYQFDLSQGDVNMLMKAVNIVGAQNISILGDGKKVRLVAGDRKILASNSYSKDIGDFDEALECHLQVSNFIIIPDDYTATLSKKKLLHLKGKNKKVEYFIALEPDSKL